MTNPEFTPKQLALFSVVSRMHTNWMQHEEAFRHDRGMATIVEAANHQDAIMGDVNELVRAAHVVLNLPSKPDRTPDLEASIAQLTARVAGAPEAADPAVEVTRERLLAAEGNRLRDKCKGMAQEYGAYEAFTGWLFDNSGTLLAALARSVGPDLRATLLDCQAWFADGNPMYGKREMLDRIARALGKGETS